MELSKSPLADLASIHMRLNTGGNIVLTLDISNAKEVDILFNDENGPTTYGFIIRQLMEKFEDEYYHINTHMHDVVKGLKVN